MGTRLGEAEPRRACGTLNVVEKLNVGMRRFCTVGKVLLATLRGEKRKTEMKSRKLFYLHRNVPSYQSLQDFQKIIVTWAGLFLVKNC